jgi:hypothetical protein
MDFAASQIAKNGGMMANIIEKIQRERRELRHPILLIEGRQIRAASPR